MRGEVRDEETRGEKSEKIRGRKEGRRQKWGKKVSSYAVLS